MNKANFDYSSLEADREATYRQKLGIGNLFSGKGFKCLQEGEKPDWAQGRRIAAMITDYHANISKDTLTHGRVQEIRALKSLPKVYKDLYDKDKVGMNTVDRVSSKETSEPVSTKKPSSNENLLVLDLNDPEAVEKLRKALHIDSKVYEDTEDDGDKGPSNSEIESEEGNFNP